MFGEYLRAFEDTFGHRTIDNTPIAVNAGWGHFAELHAPDYACNKVFKFTNPKGIVISSNWKYNEDRTLEMEHEVFLKMSAVKDDKLTAQKWEDVKPFLEKFNAINENSDNTGHFKSENKRWSCPAFLRI